MITEMDYYKKSEQKDTNFATDLYKKKLRRNNCKRVKS